MYRPLLACIVVTLAVAVSPIEAGQKRSVADLIADLKKTDVEKLKALEALEALGDKAGEAAPALVELLAQQTEDVRLAAAMGGRVGRLLVVGCEPGPMRDLEEMCGVERAVAGGSGRGGASDRIASGEGPPERGEAVAGAAPRQ